MRVLVVHNEYGKVSGEEIVVGQLVDVLRQQGHEVATFFRSSAELTGQRAGSAKAFFTGIYNFSSRQSMRGAIDAHRPDVVHVHNLYPLISPSVLPVCRRERVPVVMTVHNYRLMCPNGLHLTHGQVCERCVGGREYNCLLHRCEGSLFKSAGYALRGMAARRMRLFHDNVTLYAALTDFQRRKMISAGYPAERIVVIPNMTGDEPAGEFEPGQWVGYAGRVSGEKGIPTLMAAARLLPDVPFRIAGAADRMPGIRETAPPNVTFLGHLQREELAAFQRGCRMMVLCSTWYEGFPMMLAEAMLRAKPVVCSNIGGLPEIVDDGESGFLFTPGNEQELANRIRRLWGDAALCQKMGEAGRSKAANQFSPARYYQRTLEAYRLAKSLVLDQGRATPRKLLSPEPNS